MAGGYSHKRVQAGGAAKFRDVPEKNGFCHVAESLQYLLVGGGEARLLVKTPPQRTQGGVGGDGVGNDARRLLQAKRGANKVADSPHVHQRLLHILATRTVPGITG